MIKRFTESAVKQCKQYGKQTEKIRDLSAITRLWSQRDYSDVVGELLIGMLS